MRGSSAGRRCSAGARQCALRRGLREPWHMSGVQGGRNSGSQHGRSNHEHERSRATRTMVRLAQESAGSSSGGQDGAQHVAARRQRSAEQDVQARQGLQRALGAKVPT